MDDVRAFIARSSNRDEDQIEKADTTLAAVAAEVLEENADFVCIVTTDRDAGEGVVAALEANGYVNRVRFENGFELIDDIV